MKAILMFSLVLVLPWVVWGGQLRIEPASIAPGEVALLSWSDGGNGTGTVEFNGRIFTSEQGAHGGVALLGTDLETAPGEYSVRVRLPDSVVDGRLRVVATPRREERITLPKAMVSPSDPIVLQRIERERMQLTALFAKTTHGALPEKFLLPVPDPLGSPFGLRRILNGEPRSPHAGVDFRSPRGRPVKAGAPGKVVYAGDLYFTGLTVVVDHGGGLFTLYCHLGELNCAVGQGVDIQAILGRVGRTGRATGAHLHWGVKLRGDRIDPLALVALLDGKKS